MGKRTGTDREENKYSGVRIDHFRNIKIHTRLQGLGE